jgi:hypothetical protein
MASSAVETTGNLPPDNASQLAIYDVLYDPRRVDGIQAMPEEELFRRVIGRLRILVPRELHLAGERPFFEAKVDACVAAGIVLVSLDDEGHRTVALTGRRPQIRYPDGEVRDYPPGLELARERLDVDNARLRAAGFDVREALPSAADNPDGPEFQGLLASMREHGFLKQFPVLRHEDDVIVDGRARLLAAAILHLDVEYLKYGSDRDRTAARRRDTPLDRVLVALDSNADRLSVEAVEAAHRRVAEVTERPWEMTAADLALTREWRRSVPAERAVTFEVEKIAYRDEEGPKVQITADDKVMLRSLIRAAGLDGYKINVLRDYVPFEQARSAHSGGRKAVFVRAGDLIGGIGTMLEDRRTANRKIDPEWEQIREWLLGTFGSAPA